jgi:hypothetical protein
MVITGAAARVPERFNHLLETIANQCLSLLSIGGKSGYPEELR